MKPTSRDVDHLQSDDDKHQIVPFNLYSVGWAEGKLEYLWCYQASYDIKQRLDPVGSTVRYEMMKLCTGSV